MYKILIAEDETIERMVLCKTIRKHLGEVCTVCEAKNGREALEVFRREQPHIAILDIQMPGLTGLEVAHRIRESGSLCVILFLSAYDHFEYAREAIAVRAMDYVLKPYGEQEMIASVEEAIRISDWQSERLAKTRPAPARTEEARTTDSSHTALVREEIEQYILEHFSDDLSMQDVARAMNYSDTYFCKLFKQCFKVNFSTYLNEYRIRHAKDLLAAGNDSIRDISLQCGYTDSTYFSRVFRRITGVTPSEYRTNQEKG